MVRAMVKSGIIELSLLGSHAWLGDAEDGAYVMRPLD
jgi:hypothetical protein